MVDEKQGLPDIFIYFYNRVKKRNPTELQRMCPCHFFMLRSGLHVTSSLKSLQLDSVDPMDYFYVKN